MRQPGGAECHDIRVVVADDAPDGWDQYVDRHAHGSAYHRSAAVSIGRRAFGLRTNFLVAHRDDGREIVGVLPLIEQSSWLFGRYLVSLPFFTYGGILADDDRIASALAQRAERQGHDRRVDHVELRHTAPMDALGMAERLDKVSMILALPDSEETLARQVGSKLRSQIRRAQREDPQIVWGGAELLNDFYRVFSATMRDLGTPVYPRRFFDITLRALEGLISVLVIRVRGQVQAAAIVVRHGKRVEVPWAAATGEAKRTSVNLRMYWEMLRFAIETGATAFDFGRSSVDSGTYRFKAQWGAAPMQLHWHYWLASGGALPNLTHSNSKYSLATACWRRLPLWCANLLGPRLIRNLP